MWPSFLPSFFRSYSRHIGRKHLRSQLASSASAAGKLRVPIVRESLFSPSFPLHLETCAVCVCPAAAAAASRTDGKASAGALRGGSYQRRPSSHAAWCVRARGRNPPVAPQLYLLPRLRVATVLCERTLLAVHMRRNKSSSSGLGLSRE